MRVTNLTRLLALIALGAFSTSTANASTIFSDNFESGSMANWTQTSATAGTNLVISTAQNIIPAGGTQSAAGNNSADRMHRNIIADNGGVELTGYGKFTSYIYDDGVNGGTTGATRIYNEVRGYSGGTGLPNGGTAANGTLAQLLAIGKGNQATGIGSAFTATKYQGRIAFGPVAGWFNLDAPGTPVRSVGWHKFTIERMLDNSLNFYVDDVLGRTVVGALNHSWDTLVIGPGVGTQNGNFFIDGVSLNIIPEPATTALAGLGFVGAVMAARRRVA